MRKTEVQLPFYRQESQRVGESDMMTSEGKFKAKVLNQIMNKLGLIDFGYVILKLGNS